MREQYLIMNITVSSFTRWKQNSMNYVSITEVYNASAIKLLWLIENKR